jgi:hypothetical protein
VPEELSNGSSIFYPHGPSLLKTARESVALFYRLFFFSLLQRFFFDARGVGTSALEQENNNEEK